MSLPRNRLRSFCVAGKIIFKIWQLFSRLDAAKGNVHNLKTVLEYLMLKKSFFTGISLLCLLFAGVDAGAATIKLATIAPEGSVWMTEMRKGAEEIKNRTADRVNLKFYGGGVMGNEKSVLRKIRIGQLQGGAFTSTGLSEVYSEGRLYGLPMIFRSYEEVDYVRSRMDEKLLEGLEQAGFVSFGFGEGGFALLMSHNPVSSMEDLKGKKIWIPRNDLISEVSMKHLGLSPISLPITDVLTGLQTGLLDSVATPPVGAIAFQWHVKVKYVTDVPLAYTFATLVVDKRAFERLSSADQLVVREVMGGIYDLFNRQSREDNAEAFNALVEHGIQIVEPSPEEVAMWREKSEEVCLKMKKDSAFDGDLYEKMKGLLSEFRNQGNRGAEQ
jgi:TRAP-type C4-dicarboxylate transport system substrate-binding protein